MPLQSRLFGNFSSLSVSSLTLALEFSGFSPKLYIDIKLYHLYLSMINLRNIPFFAVAVANVLLGTLAFKNDLLIWLIFALIFFVMGIAFSKQIDTADGSH